MNAKRIETELFVSDIDKRKFIFTLTKHMPITKLDNHLDRCVIFIDGNDFIINISFEKINQLQKSL